MPPRVAAPFIRLPLQVGHSSLACLARVAFTMPPGVLLLWLGIDKLVNQPGAGGLLVSVPGLVLLGYAAFQLYHAVGTRASDARLDGEQLAIDGGVYAGLRVPWAAVDGERTRAETVEETRLPISIVMANASFAALSMLLTNQLELLTDERTAIRRLLLVTHDGRTLRLAEAEDLAEQASLDALLGSIRARLGLDAAPAAPTSTEILLCAGCGAPLPPSEAAFVSCGYCGRPATVPDELRSRLAAQRAVEQTTREAESAITALLSQPGAGRTNLRLLVTAVGCVLAWSLAMAPMALVGLDNLSGLEITIDMVAGASSCGAVLLFASAGLADRRALRVLSSSFGARAPAWAGGAWGCRRCGAPLPAESSLIARCAYCTADNVLGIDMRSQVAPTREHSRSLAELLKARDQVRRRSRKFAWVAVVLALLGGVVAVSFLEVAWYHARALDGCAQRDAEACFDVGTDYDLGVIGEEDDAKALPYYLRGCELGHGESCLRVSQAYRWGWGTTADPIKGKTFRERACALGDEPACADED